MRCIVTGSSGGIGEAICQLLRSRGYELLHVGRQRPASIPGDFIFCDLSNYDSVIKACEEITSLGQVWALVNNAGVGHAASLRDTDDSDLLRVFRVNTFSALYLAKAASEIMVDGGRIVNILSTVMYGRPDRGAYAASKAALASLTKVWALELARRNITVNAVCPGPTETAMFRSRNPVGSAGDQRAKFDAVDGRIGIPMQIASAVEFLVNPVQEHITGQIVSVDGGTTIGRQ